MNIDLKTEEDDSGNASPRSGIEAAVIMDDTGYISVNDKSKESEIDETHGDERMEEEGAESLEEQKSCTIKPIDTNVVHRICSGQVVVTLATAVKELVENSIDAGASSIDIRLVEYGTKTIEVVDNGCGVEEVNFEGLGLKHHTSKIQDFEDITSIQTFGFRGEALSSLCALSDITIITKFDPDCTKSKSYDGSNVQGHGFRIEYDSKGKIKKKSPCARAVGTTVVVKNLFHTLPVRHCEFIKNMKREFRGMVNVLNGYCLITSGVRISCRNQAENGSVTNIVSVPVSCSTKEKISLIFGSKQLDALMEINETCLCLDDNFLSRCDLEEVSENPFKIKGFVSAPYKGRCSNDRQFVFINGRPCDSTKIVKIVNELYHNYSKNQFPFLFLDIRTQSKEVDVNVTPDKRQIYFRNEKILYATIQFTLSKVFQNAACSYNIDRQQLPLFPSSLRKSGNDYPSRDKVTCMSSASQSSNEKTPREISTSTKITPFVITRSNSINENNPNEGNGRDPSDAETDGEKMGTNKKKRRKLNLNREKDKSSENDEIANCSEHFGRAAGAFSGFSHYSSHKDQSPINMGNSTDSDDETNRDGTHEDFVVLYDDELTNEAYVKTVELPRFSDSDKPCKFEIYGASKLVTTSINLSDLKEKSKGKSLSSGLRESPSEFIGRKFRARILQEDNETAEDELKKQLSQDMFAQMQIVGQFNLGFIITKHGADLFIVDQHATDEKYNFEDLEKNLVLQSHRLICPLDLQLPAASESILSDNVDVFRKNGFDFKITDDVEGSGRYQLIQIPSSKSVLFGKEDVEELIFMLEDAPHRAFYRPSRIRDMLASRACRKSVMIGDHLNKKEMQRLVHHMASMDQPWNCPHGRPTIRHLLNLNMIPHVDLKKFNHESRK